MTQVQQQRTSPFQRLLHGIAEDYKKRGYKVTIQPAATDLPEFLTKYSPDIVAEKSGESVVIDVKAPSKARRLDYWAELAGDVKRHPGWRLDLIIKNDDDQEMVPISTADIEARLQAGASLADGNMLDAALLITWSAFEASALLAAREQDLSLSNYRPSALISLLYTEGLVDREEYDTLTRCMRIRNRVAHGVQSSPVDQACIEEIQRISRALLSEAPDLDVAPREPLEHEEPLM